MPTEDAQPTLSVHRLPLYNPSRLKDEEILAAFSARLPLLDRLMSDLEAEQPASRAQHHLIIGQRGMGKTLLLARIAAGLRTGPLKTRFIPLVFAEEQYAVDRLSKFWLNCLDSLADEHDRQRNQTAVDQIDRAVSRLTSRFSARDKDAALADEALETFLSVTAATGRRPVLLVDNLQLVFERLSKDEQHSLREVLMRSGCPILIGASPAVPSQTQDYGAAFYDHFKLHYLRALSEAEMCTILLHLADGSNRPDVRQRVLEHPERLIILQQLSGGNPRTTVTLFFLYAEDFSPNVFSDLENLLDRVTPLYKARFEELSDQQQVIASAIANHWDPVTAAQLAETTGLPASQLSPQLDRLDKLGFIEKVPLHNIAANGYQIAERFFNIWYLMRSASRRQRRQVEFLTRFLQSFYAPPERDQLARSLLDRRDFTSDSYLFAHAAADALENRIIGEDLKRHAQLDILRQQGEVRRRLDDILDISTLAPATLEWDELRKKLAALVPPHAKISPEDFADRILGDRQMFISGDRERLAARTKKLSAAEIRRTLKALQESRKLDEDKYSIESIQWFSDRLVHGQLRTRDDAEDWDRAFQMTDDKVGIQLMVATLPDNFGSQLTRPTIACIRQHLTPTGESACWTWYGWAHDLHRKLALHPDAETAYRQAIATDPEDVYSWSGLGNLLSDHLERYDEAEAAYRQAITIEPRFPYAWNGLGNLLTDHFRRYDEAEAAYRQAIEIDPENAYPWTGLGDLLADHLQRYDEAEAAYRQAVAIDPKYTYAWNGLGNLLADHLQRYNEAETIFRQAIATESKDAYPWNNLGNLLADHLRRYNEAETTFRQAIAIEPKDAYPWNGLGNVLSEDSQRRDEAEAAYRQAITIDPRFATAWRNLGLLYNDLQRFKDAEAAFREAISLHPTYALAWHDLGLVLYENLYRFGEAEAAFHEAITLEPTRTYVLKNIVALQRDYLAQATQAHSTFAQWPVDDFWVTQDLTALHEALFSAYDSKWDTTAEFLNQALDEIDDAFPSYSTKDWHLAAAVLLHLNYGAELLQLLESRGDDTRLRPWYEAIRAAHLGGRAYLQNIAPEVRPSAESFYDAIDRILTHLPESTRRRPKPEAGKKPRRAKKS